MSEGLFLLELEQRGYAEIEHGVSQDDIQELIEHYTRFTTQHPLPEFATMSAMLPVGDDPEILGEQLDVLDRSRDTQTTWHKYRTNVDGVGKPDGYTNRFLQVAALEAMRGVQLQEEDKKEFYHYTPVHLGKVAAAHLENGWGNIPPEVYRLDTAFSRIHMQISRIMVSMCSVLEHTHPGLMSEVTKESILGSPLRLLFYHPSAKDVRANFHYDKSLVTLQIAESHRGLQVATQPGAEAIDIERDHTKGVFFVSHSLSGRADEFGRKDGMFPNSSLRPAWHGVRADVRPNSGVYVPEAARNICARWALVYFLNRQNYVDAVKRTMHTR